MRPVPPDALSVLLYRTVLLPDDDAIAAWRRAERLLDLDDPSPPGAEVFGLLSHRLVELGVDFPGLARFHGIRRHNWVAARMAIAEIPRLEHDAPVLVGRAATVVAYLPAPGTAPIGAAETTKQFDGPVIEVVWEGASFRVPAPAHHVVWAVERGRWLDAVLTLLGAAPSWESIVEVVARRHRPLGFHQRVSMLEQLGVHVPPWAVQAAKPSLLEAMSARVRGRVAATLRSRPADLL
jgi:hypothetical protein